MPLRSLGDSHAHAQPLLADRDLRGNNPHPEGYGDDGIARNTFEHNSPDHRTEEFNDREQDFDGLSPSQLRPESQIRIWQGDSKTRSTFSVISASKSPPRRLRKSFGQRIFDSLPQLFTLIMCIAFLGMSRSMNPFTTVPPYGISHRFGS